MYLNAPVLDIEKQDSLLGISHYFFELEDHVTSYVLKVYDNNYPLDSRYYSRSIYEQEKEAHVTPNSWSYIILNQAFDKNKTDQFKRNAKADLCRYLSSAANVLIECVVSRDAKMKYFALYVKKGYFTEDINMINDDEIVQWILGLFSMMSIKPWDGYSDYVRFCTFVSTRK